MIRARSVVFLLTLGLLGLGWSASAQTQDNTAMREAGKRAAEAQTALNKAQQTRNLLGQRIRAQFETKPEWTQAVTQQKNAQRAYDQAKQPVLDKVRTSDEYKKLAEQKTKVDADMEKLRDRGGNATELAALATKSVELSSEMSKLEFEALNADPKLAEAKKAVTEATQKVQAQRMIADEAMKSDAEYVEASKLVDEAQAKVTEANKQLADQRKSAADAARAASQSRSPSRSRSSRPRSGGY